MKFTELDGLHKDHKDILLSMFAFPHNLRVKKNISLTVISKEYLPCYKRIEGCTNTALFKFKYELSNGLFSFELCENCLEKELNRIMSLYVKVFSEVKQNLEEKYLRKVRTDLMKAHDGQQTNDSGMVFSSNGNERFRVEVPGLVGEEDIQTTRNNQTINFTGNVDVNREVELDASFAELRRRMTEEHGED